MGASPGCMRTSVNPDGELRVGSCQCVRPQLHGVSFVRPTCFGPVFVSTKFNKCTEDLLRMVSNGYSHEIDIKASMPRYNLQGTGRLPEHAERLDVPAYGLRITDAVVKLFAIRGMDATAQQLECLIPERRLNRVVQEKFANKYSEKLIAALEGCPPMDATGIRNHQAAIERLKNFARELGQLSPDTEYAQSLSAWRAFVQGFLVNESWKQHLGVSWEDLLHAKDVLKNFGFDEDVAEGLLQENAVALNWLSKALTCYSLPGSLSDIVNLAFAMTNTKVTAGVPVAEDQIIAVLTSLRKEIENGNSALWTPSVFIQDAELDDMLCWLLLQHVSSEQGKKLEVYIQLPLLEAGDSRTDALNAVHSNYQRFCRQVFRDPDSSNTDAILLAYTH